MVTNTHNSVSYVGKQPQTAANTHLVRLIEKINRQQKPKNDPSQDKHSESLLWFRQAP